MSKIETSVKEILEQLPDEISIQNKTDYPKAKQSYEGAEHSDIGNFAFNKFLGELPEDSPIKELILSILPQREKKPVYDPFDDKSKSFPNINIHKLQVRDDFELSPGDIVALGGDFFGVPYKPISFAADPKERKALFKEAVRTLNERLVDPQSEQKLRIKMDALINHIREESENLRPHSHWELRLLKQKAIASIPLQNNARYLLEQADEKSFSGFWHSPFLSLGLSNFDHFGEDAKKAYLAGHACALDLVQEAKNIPTNDPNRISKQRALLQLALIYIFFACHFLTDLFASGHVRTPRRELLNHVLLLTNPNLRFDLKTHTPNLTEISAVDLIMASLLAKSMHDEDCQAGVEVRCGNETWTAYGDGNYYNEFNQPNARKTIQVVVMAFQDLVRVFNGQPALINEETINHYVPYAIDQKNEPMYRVENNRLLPRQNSFHAQLPIFGKSVTLRTITKAELSLSFTNLFTVKIKPSATKVVEATEHAAAAVMDSTKQVAIGVKQAVSGMQEVTKAIGKSVLEQIEEVEKATKSKFTCTLL